MGGILITSVASGAVYLILSVYRSINSILSIVIGVHSGPIYTNLVAEGVLRTLDPSASLTVRLHPLPETKKEEETLTSFSVTNLIFLTIIVRVVPLLPCS